MCSKCNDPNVIVHHRPLWLDDVKWLELKTKAAQRFRELIAENTRQHVAEARHQGGAA